MDYELVQFRSPKLKNTNFQTFFQTRLFNMKFAPYTIYHIPFTIYQPHRTHSCGKLELYGHDDTTYSWVGIGWEDRTMRDAHRKSIWVIWFNCIFDVKKIWMGLFRFQWNTVFILVLVYLGVNFYVWYFVECWIKLYLKIVLFLIE